MRFYESPLGRYIIRPFATFFVLVATVFGVAPNQLAAQLPFGVETAPIEAGPLLLELPMSVRAQGLGQAFAAGFGNSDAVFYHPALISNAGFGVGLHRFGSASSLVTLSASGNWWGGSVGFGVASLEHGVESSSLDALLRDPASLSHGGPVAASSHVVSVGYRREFVGLSWGVTGKMLAQRTGGKRASTIAADLGVAYDIGFGNVALSLQNLGQGLTLGGEGLSLAKRTVLSMGTRRRTLGQLDISGSTQIVRDGGGEILAGGGVELSYWPIRGRTFIARFGARTPGDTSSSPLTFGAGFAGDDIEIDYAFGGFDSVNGVHRFSIALR